MKTRSITLHALGIATAITVGLATTASAQAKSDTRIPVRKDAPPATVVTDTVRVTTVVHDTTFIRSRPDTIRMRMRPDTVIQMQMMQPPVQKMSMLEYGVGVGPAIIMNDWRNSTKDGPNFHAHVGYFPGAGMYGIRLGGDYAMLSHRATDCPNCPDPSLLSGSADLVLRFQVDETAKSNPIIYVLGGGGIHKFSNFLPYRNSDGLVVTAGSSTYTAENGFNTAATLGPLGTGSTFYSYGVGAGAQITIANNLRFYVESKYTTIFTDGGNSHLFPLVMGLSF